MSPAGGKVFVHGENWNALSDEVIEQGTIEVVRLEQHEVFVKRAQSRNIAKESARLTEERS